MGSEQQWRLNLKCSTAQASHFYDYESLVNDIVEFFSLQESVSLEVSRACASASERLGLAASCTTKKPPESLQRFHSSCLRREGRKSARGWPFSSGGRRTTSEEKGLTLRAYRRLLCPNLGRRSSSKNVLKTIVTRAMTFGTSENVLGN